MAFAINVNPSHSVIAEFIPWAHDNHHLVDDVVALGYVAFRYGITDKYASVLLNKNASSWAAETESLRQQLCDATGRLATVEQQAADDRDNYALNLKKVSHKLQSQHEQSVLDQLALLRSKDATIAELTAKNSAAVSYTVADLKALHKQELEDCRASAVDMYKTIIHNKEAEINDLQQRLLKERVDAVAPLQDQLVAKDASFKQLAEVKDDAYATLKTQYNDLFCKHKQLEHTMHTMNKSHATDMSAALKEAKAEAKAGAVAPLQELLAAREARIKQLEAMHQAHTTSIKEAKAEAAAAYQHQLQSELQAAVIKTKSDEQLKLLDLQKHMAAVSKERDCLKQSLHDVTASQQSREIERLRKENEAYQKTNMGKGHRGENAVAAVLKRSFTKHEIDIKGGGNDPHSCDVWMTDCDGKIIAVEVKNKATVSKADVDKLYRDVDDMVGAHRPVIGGVFVSIASKNIPKKGCLCFEIHNKVPVYFIGFDNHVEMELLFPAYINAFTTLCTYNAGASEQSVDQLITKIKPIVAEINKLQKAASNMRTQMSSISESLKDIDAVVQAQLKIIHHAVPDVGAVPDIDKKPITTTVRTTASIEGLVKSKMLNACDSCSIKYAYPGSLANHYISHPSHKKKHG